MSDAVQVRDLNQPEPQQMRLDHLLDAIGNLERVADTDEDCNCYGDEQCTPEKPVCELNRARSAIASIERAFEFEIRSLWPHRLSNYEEWCYVEKFRQLNKRQRGLNNGYRFLELVLGQPRERRWYDARGVTPAAITQRDADVATAVVQWLGTPCGAAFLSDVERRIRQARESQRTTQQGVHDWLWNQRRPPIPDDPIRFEAERIAVTADPDGKARDGAGHSLADTIEGAIRRFAGRHSGFSASAESAAL